MEVKTGQLRNNLSRYLKRVRQTGDTIIVMDRNHPIAEIRPLDGSQENANSGVWESRKQHEKVSGSLHEDFQLPDRHTDSGKRVSPLD